MSEKHNEGTHDKLIVLKLGFLINKLLGLQAAHF